GKVLQKAFKCFSEKTGVKVNVQWLGRKAYTQNIAPALNTDNVPDLFDQDVSKVSAAIVSAGGTQSVDDVFDLKVGEGEKKVKDAADPTGQAWKTDPGFLKAATETAKLPKYLIDGWDAAKFPQVQQRWADGDARFLYMGTWAPSETREYLDKQGAGTKLEYGS